jgi:hypothetical protein
MVHKLDTFREDGVCVRMDQRRVVEARVPALVVRPAPRESHSNVPFSQGRHTDSQRGQPATARELRVMSCGGARTL